MHGPALVVLDARTTTPHMDEAEPPADEPTWNELRALADRIGGGGITVHPITEKAQRVERAAGASAVILNKAALNNEDLAALPKLRYIGLLSTGTNAVDLEECTRRGIAVTNVPAYSTPSVAQHIFALLLELTNNVAAHNAEVQRGRWQHGDDFSFTVAPVHELAGRSLGVIGFGDIGQQTADIGRALGMNVLVHSRTRRQGPEHVPVRWLELDDLLRESDAIALCCPLTPATEKLINGERLALMKPTAYLVNASRGGLIDEPALADALTRRALAGAGLDVLAEEPPRSGSPLIGLDNCLITPHIAWASRAARRRLVSIVADNLRSWLNGGHQNRVA